MRTRRCKHEIDGTGRAPAGTRRLRPVEPGRVSMGLFFRALGWVYLHLRLRFGLPLQELAALAQVGVQTLCDLEHGGHGARPETEWQVAHALGYEPEEVMRLTRRWLRRKFRTLRAAAMLLVMQFGELSGGLLDELAMVM